MFFFAFYSLINVITYLIYKLISLLLIKEPLIKTKTFTFIKSIKMYFKPRVLLIIYYINRLLNLSISSFLNYFNYIIIKKSNVTFN